LFSIELLLLAHTIMLFTQNKDGLRSLSQIYTRSSFDRVIREKDFKFINNRIKKHINLKGEFKYIEVLKTLYEQLQKTYRSEYFYKNALLNKLLLGTYSPNTTTVLNEFKIGSSIADFVLLNGEARVYEIKTDLDSLDKLEKQVFDYSQFANKIYIVTSSKHIQKLKEFSFNIPIGLIEFTRQDTLKLINEAESCSENFDPTIIFKTLRKQEYLDIIEGHFGYLPEAPNTLLFKQCLELAKRIDITTFQRLAFEKLKERKLNCQALLEAEQTPYELKHICYIMNLSKNEYQHLYRFLNKAVTNVSSLS